MPLYTYNCILCSNIQELIVNIEERDYSENRCLCGGELKRKIDFNGSVYAPTAKNGGMAT